ncbi:TIGR01777 family oxidoreductase [Vampirovibrio sp.]|uniref:TIGR01777 family oxidoreductase n=1 Tax=Vampirovibrio sp. TaxID=2717857 RepID=UPI003593D1F0
MKVLISGASGLVGSELIHELKRQGHQPVRLVRRKGLTSDPEITWDINAGKLDAQQLHDIDAVIHLAGENIAGGRWSDERKQKIVESRVKGTRLIAETLAKLDHPPKVFICASAVGFYGNRGDEVLNDVSGKGSGFLADTCKQWEDACQPARDKGIRVVNSRFGIILSPKGGALKAMYWPFKLGMAGDLGNGKQYMSWIALEDVVGALAHMLTHDDLKGPVNVVSPNPVTNHQFTDAMRKAVICPMLPMHYWTPPAPAFAVKAVLGEMADQLLLASQRVQPVALLGSGYTFRQPELKAALDSLL